MKRIIISSWLKHAKDRLQRKTKSFRRNFIIIIIYLNYHLCMFINDKL
ncbi:hypothetical protein FWK35_00028882 [Aphis craccivora]|uniref:Uncharacterized protein n=1 Tax=Aphis craccivora TaxID=307492 RepID=A0A6G0W0T3_APHCR|nr:hypothetical protein FWK35_00028882 [Aphis craccivora]